MFREQVLAPLEAATQLLTEADPQTVEQAESFLKTAFERLQALLNERPLSSDELRAVNRQCRRIGRLLASAQGFYADLTNIMSIQAMGYGSAATKPGVATGRRFVIEA